MINPIFKRHWQTEVTQRSVATSGLLIFFCLFLSYSAITTNPFDNKLHESMLYAFSAISTLAGVLCIFKTSQGMNEEFNQSTWDWIRTSSVSADTILFGKIFGPGALHWLIIFSCYLLAQIYTFIFFEDSKIYPSLLANTFQYSLSTLATILCATIAVFSLLITKNTRRRITKGNAGILLSLFIIPYFNYYESDTSFITWYNLKFNADIFVFSWLAAFSLLALFSGYSLIRKELQSRLLPVELPISALILALFCAGFAPTQAASELRYSYFDLVILVNNLILFSITYSSIIGMSDQWIPLKIFITKVLKKDFPAALMSLPSWLGMLLLMSIFWIISLTLSSESIQQAMIACIIILVRDMSIILLILFDTRLKIKKTTITVFIVLTFIYALIPAFLLLFKLKQIGLLILPIPMLLNLQANFTNTVIIWISGIISLTLFYRSLRVLILRARLK